MTTRAESICIVLACFLQLLSFSDAQEIDFCLPKSKSYDNFVSIPENVPPDTLVYTINTKGRSPIVSLRPAAELDSQFVFDNSSQQIRTRGSIDVDDKINSDVEINILCTQQDSSVSLNITIIIAILDVNDNPPVFMKNTYTITVGETTRMDQIFDSGVRATDADRSYRSAISYTVQDSGAYSDYLTFPDPLTPSLQLLKVLDFESLPNFNITVVATNVQSDIHLSSTCLLMVEVRDDDDLNPVFSSTLYHGSIVHTAEPGSVVDVVPPISAYDADITINSPLVYSFHVLSPASDLTVDHATALLSRWKFCDTNSVQSHGFTDVAVNHFALNNLTAEVRMILPTKLTKMSVILQAIQGDNPFRIGVAMLVITVLGVNLNAPQFFLDHYQVHVSEEMAIGIDILQMLAVDPDVGTVLKYKIVGGSNIFAIRGKSGWIYLTQKLDYEVSQVHEFTVMASDGQFHTTSTVEVAVVDSNDNSPIVVNDRVTLTDVHRVTGSVLTTVEAYDLDQDAIISFHLQNHNSLFTVDSHGVVRLSADASDLDEDRYTLLITVEDGGEPCRLANALVAVTFVHLPPDSNITGIPSTHPSMCTDCSTVADEEAVVMAAAVRAKLAAITLGVMLSILLIFVILLLVYIHTRHIYGSERRHNFKGNLKSNHSAASSLNSRPRRASRCALHSAYFSEEMNGDGGLDGPHTLNNSTLLPANTGFTAMYDINGEINDVSSLPCGGTDIYYNNNNDEVYQHGCTDGDVSDSVSFHGKPLMDGYYHASTNSSISSSACDNKSNKLSPMLDGLRMTSFGANFDTHSNLTTVVRNGKKDRVRNVGSIKQPHGPTPELTVYF